MSETNEMLELYNFLGEQIARLATVIPPSPSPDLEGEEIEIDDDDEEIIEEEEDDTIYEEEEDEEIIEEIEEEKS